MTLKLESSPNGGQMSAFTPGPWEVSDTGGNILAATGDVVASVHGFPKPWLTGEGAENGRLIAAAPELLAVAIRIVGAAISQPKDREAKLQEVSDLARAAIAKAVGK